MRAFLQKLRGSTSSKGTTTGYTPTSKELEKEKRFPPLPEWPPPSLNNTIKEPLIIPTTTPISLSLDTTTQRPKSPSNAPSVSRPAYSVYLESDLPPVPPLSERRGSNTSTTTEVAKRVPTSKETQPGQRDTPPPAASPVPASTQQVKVNGVTNNTTTFTLGGAEERRKGNSVDSAAPSKTPATGRGSTTTDRTFATIKVGTSKNSSVRALVTSPTPLSQAGHGTAVNVPAHLHHRPPHSTGKYNSMGLPMADNVSFVRPGTSMSHMSGRTVVLTTASWSEAADEDLVSNLGQRERTRQEVLWEIVASEQRYVHELMMMKETFIDPLLHPFAANPLAGEDDERAESPVQSVEHLPIASRFLGAASIRSPTPNTADTRVTTQRSNTTPQIPTPDVESDSDADYESGANAEKLLGKSKKTSSFAMSAAAKANHPRSPYGTTSRASGAAVALNPRLGRITAASSRSHQSLPPPPRGSAAANGATSTTSLGRKSGTEKDEKDHPQRAATTEPGHERRHDRHARFAPSPPPGTGKLKKTRRGSEDGPAVPKLVSFRGGVPPHVLPEDLRKCLEVIENGILLGHLKLSEALRKRYDEQYPLVRSLADVFVGNSEILHEYATYVLHLERALEQVSEALNRAALIKKSRQPENTDAVKVARLLAHLEQTASDKGETGLAISLSKPFQRLLKYPLLFQNLLYHTDPSTFEYESTLEMVSEVETIVRSIEDEKIQKEERDKTRDALARIDGLEKDKVLAAPKSSRLLLDEKPQEGSFADLAAKSASPPPTAFDKSKGVKNKNSFRRISEVIGSREAKDGLGSKRDLWLVAFNDVVLLCQRTGTTTLPLSITSNSRANSLPDGQGKTKHSTTGKRASNQTRPRNLYRFLKVESWTINEKPRPRELVSKEAIERWRTQQASGHLLGAAESPTEDDVEGAESDDSDRKSKMSFSYWGADKVTLSKPMAKRGVPTNASRTQLRTKPQAPSSFAGRQSEKESKFGGRLRSPEPSHAGSVVGSDRPTSRRTGASPTMTRRNLVSTVDSKITTGSMTSVVSSRPGWDGSTRNATAASGGVVAGSAGGQPTKRVRNTSVTSGPPRVGNAKTLSAVPSEDSGVGMYRQIIAHDPSISSTKA